MVTGLPTGTDISPPDPPFPTLDATVPPLICRLKRPVSAPGFNVLLSVTGCVLRVLVNVQTTAGTAEVGVAKNEAPLPDVPSLQLHVVV